MHLHAPPCSKSLERKWSVQCSPILVMQL
uniref:Uncharacterized protein n=1 Tax=Rhizophora mucronata TaxID=61149 RepID=A0A2P2R3B9_RHIMU